MILFFLDSVHRLIVQRSTAFRKPALFPLKGQDAHNVVDPSDLSLSTTAAVTC